MTIHSIYVHIGGGGGGLLTCPYSLKVQACPPWDQRPATSLRFQGRNEYIHGGWTVYMPMSTEYSGIYIPVGGGGAELLMYPLKVQAYIYIGGGGGAELRSLGSICTYSYSSICITTDPKLITSFTQDCTIFSCSIRKVQARPPCDQTPAIWSKVSGQYMYIFLQQYLYYYWYQERDVAPW